MENKSCWHETDRTWPDSTTVSEGQFLTINIHGETVWNAIVILAGSIYFMVSFALYQTLRWACIHGLKPEGSSSSARHQNSSFLCTRSKTKLNKQSSIIYPHNDIGPTWSITVNIVLYDSLIPYLLSISPIDDHIGCCGYAIKSNCLQLYLQLQR